ncbi:MAG: hypothetical protein IKQ69_04460 [Oscillospiraceae bacterium]|nr:hypothetical protein [Oscillospiraceae bacterium]MBR6208230.1 hypothetical protein [Oscillospiraceae bacterium]
MLHAVLLSGSGEAVKERSRVLAAAALCEGGGPKPCGQCRHCRKVFRDIHPDVTRIERGLDKKGRTRREITVDQIRDLERDAAVLPNEAAGKVYIFPEAEAMNVPAQNAFLKLLEEPPAWVTFLLCTANPERLLPTVRSRCGEDRLAPSREPLDELAAERARGYLAARRDPVELLRCCLALEKLDDAQPLLAMVRAARELAAEEAMPAAELLALEGFLGRAEQYLMANVGVKHVTGFLSTYSPEDPEYRK